MIDHVTRPFDLDCAKEHWFCATTHHANSRKEYDFPVSANHVMPDHPATAVPTHGKESRITFAYTGETPTRSFANYVQE